MLNEERIILMTKLASYEKREGRKNMKIAKYFRGDYITWNLLKSIICGTIAFLLGAGLYLLYFFEDLMENLYQIDFIVLAQNAVTIYVLFLGAYCLLTYVVYTSRFVRAKKSLKKYYTNLKKLNAMYQQDN